MVRALIPFRNKEIEISLPDGTDILSAKGAEPLPNPRCAIMEALSSPIGTQSLESIASKKLTDAFEDKREAKACVVVSDNTRPVPYRGENGILMPVLETLVAAGFKPNNICILIANGTHVLLSEKEIRQLIGDEPFELGVEVVNHNCHDNDSLVNLGESSRGTKILVNKRYYFADLHILTGLVESHFMAGASGGRKSVCPGIVGIETTRIFHGAELMASPNARDLVIDNNPVHEESLAVAKAAGVDFIINVTLDNNFDITGVFCGGLEPAHRAAVEKICGYVAIPVTAPYDIVITHGGFVAINHYQSAKASVAASYAVKDGGSVILAADNCAPNPIGSDNYKINCELLKLLGPDTYKKLLKSDFWHFMHDQWQTQMYCRLFDKVKFEDFFYFSPQLNDNDCRILPGVNAKSLLPKSRQENASLEDLPDVIDRALNLILSKKGFTYADIASGKCRVVYLSEGPYAIPIHK